MHPHAFCLTRRSVKISTVDLFDLFKGGSVELDVVTMRALMVVFFLFWFPHRTDGLLERVRRKERRINGWQRSDARGAFSQVEYFLLRTLFLDTVERDCFLDAVRAS
jgi:hypothetical protein